MIFGFTGVINRRLAASGGGLSQVVGVAPTFAVGNTPTSTTSGIYPSKGQRVKPAGKVKLCMIFGSYYHIFLVYY